MQRPAVVDDDRASPPGREHSPDLAQGRRHVRACGAARRCSRRGRTSRPRRAGFRRRPSLSPRRARGPPTCARASSTCRGVRSTPVALRAGDRVVRHIDPLTAPDVEHAHAAGLRVAERVAIHGRTRPASQEALEVGPATGLVVYLARSAGIGGPLLDRGELGFVGARLRSSHGESVRSLAAVRRRAIMPRRMPGKPHDPLGRRDTAELHEDGSDRRRARAACRVLSSTCSCTPASTTTTPCRGSSSRSSASASPTTCSMSGPAPMLQQTARVMERLEPLLLELDARRRPRAGRRELDDGRRARRRQAARAGRTRRGRPAQLRPHHARGDQPGRRRLGLRRCCSPTRLRRATTCPRGRPRGRDPLRRQHDDRHARGDAPRIEAEGAPARHGLEPAKLSARHAASPGARGRPAARRGACAARRWSRENLPVVFPVPPAHARRAGGARDRARRARAAC